MCASNRQLSAGLVVLSLCGLLGCQDKDPPTTIPMEADTLSAPTPKTTAKPLGLGNTGTQSSTAAPKPHWSRTIGGCCSTLRALANRSKKDADKKMYTQAANLCVSNTKLVLQGKLKRGPALAQVRSSLLGKAPASCY